MSATNDDRSDVLDKAVEALRNVPIPDGPPPEVVAATVRTLETSLLSPENNRPERKALMFRIARFGGLSAAAVTLVAIGWLLFMNGTTTVAFAEVVDNVKKAKSLTMICRERERLLEDDQVKGREFEYKISVEVDLCRMDIADNASSIVNFRDGKAMLILHDKKTAYEYILSKEELAEASPYYDTMDKFSKIVPKDAKLLKDEQLNGKKVHVFAVAKCDLFKFEGKGKMKVWVDPKSNLPLKIRIEQNGNATVFDKLVWNKPLDPKLFELKAPDGYEVKDGMPQ